MKKIEVTNDTWMAAANTHSVAVAEGMRGKELWSRVASAVLSARGRPLHEPVTSEELEAMMNEIHYGTAGSWFENVRAAGNALLARRAAPELKSVHDPVTADEAEKFRLDYQSIFMGKKMCDGLETEAMQFAVDQFLARRAAATRAEVVVTEEMRQACAKAFGWEGGAMSDVIWHAMNWMAKHLNGKHQQPVDPRVGIVLSWANNTLGAQNVLDEDIGQLLAKLDARKP